MTGKPLLKIAAFVFCTLLACFALTINSEATTTVTNLSPSFGTVGTTVTIYGTNFGTSTGTVTFYNGKSATVSSWNGTTNEIKVTVPANAAPTVRGDGFHEGLLQATASLVNPPKGVTSVQVGAGDQEFIRVGTPS